MHLIRVRLYDANKKLIEDCTLTPGEVADKVQRFMTLQGATRGRIKFDTVEVDNATQKSKFLNAYQPNFDTLLRAVKNGDTALMHCKWKKNDSPVAVICAVERPDGPARDWNFIPLAIMLAANPFELFLPPVSTLLDEEPPITDGERLVAELVELEARAGAIREMLGRGAACMKNVAISPLHVAVTLEGGCVNEIDITDATGATIEHVEKIVDLDDHNDEEDDDVECHECGSLNTEYSYTVANGLIAKCKDCGEETLYHSDHDDEEDDDGEN